MGIVSLVLAIIAIILVFIIPILGIALANVALVLGIIELLKRKKEGNNKSLPIASIIISGFSIVIAMFMIIVTVVIYFSNANLDINNNFNVIEKSNNKSIKGTWYDSKNKTTLILDSDNKFEMYTDDKTNLYIKGTYTMIKDSDDTYADEYILTMNTKNRVIKGKQHTSAYTTQFSISTVDYKSMVMMNAITYNMYYFEKVK